jgi:hypothetical protein
LFIYRNELNNLAESYIEEQKKYINYYKVKKTYGKSRENEFVEFSNKKGNELSKMDKLDMAVLSNNINVLTEQILGITDGISIKDDLFVSLPKHQIN